jgi:SnoaL-like domain
MTHVSPLTSDDRVSITDLLARYARCLDSGDLDGYVHNFAPDGVLFGAHSGHSAIRAYVSQVIARRAADPSRRMHFVGVPVIDGTGERASVHSYLLWIQLGAESPISAAAEYLDTVVKLGDRWVFESRTLNRLAGTH